MKDGFVRFWAATFALWLSAAWAGAGVDLFLTRGPAAPSVPGEKEPDTFNSAEKNFLTNYEAWAGTPERSPFIQEPNTPTTYFVWAAITLLPPSEAFAQIYTVDLIESKPKGSAYVEDGLFYRHRKLPPNAYKRWDSNGKLSLPGRADAITAMGVLAPWMGDLSNTVGTTTYALLGAVYLSGPGPGRFNLGLGPGTMAIRVMDNDGNTVDYTGDPNNRYPGLTIQGQNAYEGPYIAVIIKDRHGDMNCDGTTDFGDIHPFVLAITYPLEYKKQFPDCDIMNGDCNGDGSVDFGDINPFVALLSGG